MPPVKVVPKEKRKALMIEAIKRFHKQHGRIPTSTEWTFPPGKGEDPKRPTSHQVISAFGKWNTGIQSAGFTPRPATAKASNPRQPVVRRQSWSQPEIIEAMIDEFDRTKKWPTSNEWEYSDPKGRRPVSKIVRRHFNSTFDEVVSKARRTRAQRVLKKADFLPPVNGKQEERSTVVVYGSKEDRTAGLLASIDKRLKAIETLLSEQQKEVTKKGGLSSLFSISK